MVLTADRPVVRFLARERELGVLRRRLAATADGRGGVVAIRGPFGAGTTSLARQAAGIARATGMAVMWGDCREGLLDRPFGALAEALENGALTMPSAQVMADLGSDAPPILRICPGLAAVLPTFVPAAPLEPVDERLRLREAIASWLTRLGTRAPLLVVMDEFQLADGDLRGMVEHLGRRLRNAPVLLITVTSVAPPKGKTSKRAAKPRGVLDALELEGLDVDAVAALISAATDRPASLPTAELIQAVAHGNPLFSLELLRHMREEGLLPDPGSARLPAPAALPQTIADVVAWRVARLSPAARAALNVLAAFPRGAAVNVVAAVTSVTRSRAIEALDGLVADELVIGDARGYAVIHPVIRVALLDAMTPLLRAQLHRRIAEVLEANAGDERRQRAGELAHYWLASSAILGRERGLSHFLLAAEQARAVYAHQRAVDCLRAALTLVPGDHATTLDLTTRLAVAQAGAGLRRDALDSAVAVLELGNAAPLVRASDRESQSNEAVAAVTDTLRTLRGDGVEPAMAQLIEPVRLAALETLGPDRSSRSDSLPHARLALLAEAWQATTPGSTLGISTLVWGDLQPGAATALASLGGEADKTEVMLLQRPRSQSDAAAAAEAARTWRRPPARLRALASTVTDLVSRFGLFAEGAGWASQYLATAERYGSVRDRVRALALLARCQVATGAFAAARDSLDRGVALLPAIAGAPSPSAEMLEDELTISRFALAHFTDGDWRVLLKTLPPIERHRPAGLLLAALRCLACGRAGKLADASGLLEAVLPAAAEVPPLTLYRDAALVVTVAAAWELGAAEHAAAGLSLVGLTRNAGAGGQAEASLDLTAARLLGLAGRTTESRAAFAAARAAATATGLLPQVALADFDEAVALAAAGPRNYGEALNLLSAAGEKFERLGMHGWSDRVSALTLPNFKEAAAPGGRLFFTYPRGLSRPEADVVRLTAAGSAPSDTATELGLKRDDVERLQTSALKKLRGKSVDELPQLARRHGLGGL